MYQLVSFQLRDISLPFFGSLRQEVPDLEGFCPNPMSLSGHVPTACQN